MLAAIGSLGRRAVTTGWLFAVCLLLPRLVEAQNYPLAESPSSVEFISRLDLGMSAAALTSDDRRFAWVADWGGEIDLVDYVLGRLSFLADYEVVLGDELQPFDPNQGIYRLAASSSIRVRGTEFVGVFHHVSRHLGDRAKNFGIAWNTVNGRMLRRVGLGDRGFLDLRAEAGKVVATAFVDYSWVALADATVRRTLSPRVAIYGRGYGELYGVDADVAGRETQRGGRVEAGVRLSGPGGALELFGGYEQVIDADPIDRLPLAWFFGGFRLLSR